MIHLNDWLVPRILNEPWLEKPPLPQWAVALSFLISGGYSDTAARVPSVLFGLVGVVLIARLAARWYGSTIGLLVGCVQASTVYTLAYARLAEADIFLWAIVIGCIYVFAMEQVGPAPGKPSDRRRMAFWVLVGLTQLAKGPMFGAVMALVPCVLFTLLTRDWSRLKWFFYWPGWVVALVLSLAWPVAIFIHYPEAAALWGQHTFSRVGGSDVINPEPWWLYFTTLPWQVLPWTIVVFGALGASLRVARSDRTSPDRFLWVWLVSLFVVLSVPSAKHHHYLIYALPPISFWAALTLRPTGEAIARRFAKPGAFSVVAIVSGVLVVVAVIVVRWRLPKVATDVTFIVPTVWLVTTAVVYFCMKQAWTRACTTTFVGLAIVFGMVHFISFPRTDVRMADARMLQRLRDRLQPTDVIVSVGGDVKRQWFYLRRDVPTLSIESLNTPGSLTPGTFVLSDEKTPFVAPPSVKFDRIDRGATVVVDRVINVDASTMVSEKP